MLSLFTVVFVLFVSHSSSFFDKFPDSKSRLSDEYGLTDEELSYQFTLSWLTWLNSEVWLKEWELETNKMQTDVASVRYQLAFLTYASPLLCYKTPAYRQICENTMSNAIDRMISNKTWANLVDVYWGPDSYKISGGSCRNKDTEPWGATNVWPDPVAYQNIMYS